MSHSAGTKIHHACDGKGRPLAMILGPGQAGDSPMFPVVMEAVRVPCIGVGRAKTRPDAVLGDKAYSSRANRSLLRKRGIKTVIPEPSDQIGHRKRRGSRGGRPVNFDSETYKGRNTVPIRRRALTARLGTGPGVVTGAGAASGAPHPEPALTTRMRKVVPADRCVGMTC